MTKLKDRPSYAEFKKWVQKQGIKTVDEFKKYYKTKLPPNYPKDPQAFFTARGTWKGWGDFLGTGRFYRGARPFKEARKFVRSLGLKSYNEWRRYYKSGKKPKDIPTQPLGVYKKEWKGYGDWLG